MRKVFVLNMLSVIGLFFIVASAKQFEITEDRVYYLQCMLEEKFEPCEITADESFSRNISLLSPQIIREFYKLDEGIIQALALHNFSSLNNENLLPSPAGILLLLPTTHLSKVKQHVLSSLLDKWKTNKIVFKHLTKAILLSHHLQHLTEKLQNYDFSDANMKWIVEVISLCKLPGTNNIVEKLPLLFYSSPEFILHSHKYEKFYLLSVINKPEDFKSVCSSKCLLRFWAHTMVKNNFPMALENWIDLYTERWGYVLTGTTIEELQNLSGNSFDDLSVLYDLNFSPIQIRLLFDKFHTTKKLYKKKYSKIPNAVANLLPHQLVKVSNGINFEDLVLPSEQSRPTAFQILEIMVAENYQKLKVQNETYPISKFAYVQTLESFIKLISQPLNTSDLLQIQSKHLTRSQLYFLSNGGRIFNFTSPNLFKYSELLQMVPASDIMLNQTASHVLFHLLANANTDNVPQVFALLNKLWPELNSPVVLERILRNDKFTTILAYIPSQLILQSRSLLKLIQGELKIKLPDMFVSSLSYVLKQSENNFNFLNLNESLSFLYISLSCDDISSIDPYHFSYIMSQYNNYRILSGKIFPKKLQNCCINKLLELLNLKSILFQGYNNESKLSLLSEAEIDGIGGYIFSALPVNSIRHTRNDRAILKSIGSLSSYELLLATTLEQLNKLSTILLESLSPFEKISTILFEMGNLTQFLEPQYINLINEDYFTLLLESDYIDHQLCADLETRSAWYNLVKNSFGDPSNWSYQTLKTLGDFLLVVPLSELDKIGKEAWVYSADVLKTNYFENVYSESDKRFYEVCMSHLSNSEKELYVMDIKKIVTTLVYAAQLQLDTVISWEKLLHQKDQSNNSSVFNFVESKGEIKLTFPFRKTLISNNSVSTNFKSKFPVDLTTEDTKLNLFDSSSLSPYAISTIGSTVPLETDLEKINNSLGNDYNYYTSKSNTNSMQKESSYIISKNYITNEEPGLIFLNSSSLLPNGITFSTKSLTSELEELSSSTSNYNTSERNLNPMQSESYVTSKNYFSDEETGFSFPDTSNWFPYSMTFSDNSLKTDLGEASSSISNYYTQLNNTSESSNTTEHSVSLEINNSNSEPLVNDASYTSTLLPSGMTSSLDYLPTNLEIVSTRMINDGIYTTESNLEASQSKYSFKGTNNYEGSQTTSKSPHYDPSDNFTSLGPWTNSKMLNYSGDKYTPEYHEGSLSKTTENHSEYSLYSFGASEPITNLANNSSRISIFEKTPKVSTKNINKNTVYEHIEQNLSNSNSSHPALPVYSIPDNNETMQNDNTNNHLFPLLPLENAQSKENMSEVFRTKIAPNGFSVSDIIFSDTEITKSKIEENTSGIAFSLSSLTESSFFNSSATTQSKYASSIYNELYLKKTSPVHRKTEYFDSHSRPFSSVISSPDSILYKNKTSFEINSMHTKKSPHIFFSNNESLENTYQNFINVSVPEYSIYPLTESYTPDEEENIIHSNISELLNMKSLKIITQFLESNEKDKKLTDIKKTYSSIGGINFESNKNLRQNFTVISKKENKKEQSNLKEIKLLPLRKPVEIEPFKEQKKRSIKKWSCDALRMVGIPTEIIINENVINSLDDIDLVNCIDLFGQMHLPKSIQSLIWKRIYLKDIVLTGKMIATCNLADVSKTNFMLNNPWSLEIIYLLSKYNKDESVRQHIVDEVWESSNKPFPLELVVSLGSLVCELPEISTDVISADVLLKSSVVLGKALPCNFTCLTKLASIAIQKAAFNDPSKWTFGDVYDLGVIVSGLNFSRWNKLVTKNHEALSGLSEAAFECLPYKYIKAMKKIDRNILPIRISSRLEPNSNTKLSGFDFFGRSSHPEVPSLAMPLHASFGYKNLLFCFITIITVYHH